VQILCFDASLAERLGPRPYEVRTASSIKLEEGEGEAHAYVLYFEPGGLIGPHEAAFGQRREMSVVYPASTRTFPVDKSTFDDQ